MIKKLINKFLRFVYSPIYLWATIIISLFELGVYWSYQDSYYLIMVAINIPYFLTYKHFRKKWHSSPPKDTEEKDSL